MFTLQQYKKARYSNTMPHYTNSAKTALQILRHKEKLKTFLSNIGAASYLYCDSSDIAHEWEEAGYTITLKIEYDDFNSRWEDIIPRKWGINSQGYFVFNERYSADHESTRYRAGEGLTVYARAGDYHLRIELPEKWLRQFYDNRNYDKASAYNNMVASGKMAIEQDIKQACQEYFTIGCTVSDSQGNEIFSDYLGGCDLDYAQSGEAFLEHGMIESAREAIEKELTKQAQILMDSRPDMYQTFSGEVCSNYQTL